MTSHMQKAGFLTRLIIDKLIMVDLMHTHTVENRVTTVILSEVYQEMSLIFLKQFLNEYLLIYS